MWEDAVNAFMKLDNVRGSILKKGSRMGYLQSIQRNPDGMDGGRQITLCFHIMLYVPVYAGLQYHLEDLF